MKKNKTTKKIEKKSTGDKKERPQNKNLTPGGPGRPKGKLNYDTRVDMAIEFLANEMVKKHNAKKENKNNQITVKDIDIEGDIFAQHLNKARAGDRHFIDSFLDRRYGRAKQTVEIGNIGELAEYDEKMKQADKDIEKWEKQWEDKK